MSFTLQWHMSARPEQPLWEYLDLIGLPFRESQQALIDQYGHRPVGWSDGLNYCEINTSVPFIDGLVHPIGFQFQFSRDLIGHPSDFSAYVRLFDNNQDNFDHALRDITAIFGAGQTNSVSNTIGHQWKFGFGHINITTWPPHLNKRFGRNRRHEIISGSDTECGITIETGWRPGLSQSEKTALKAYTPIWDSDESPHYNGSPLCRDLPETMTPMKAGFGLGQSEDLPILVRVWSKSLVEVLPLDWITHIDVHSLTPAKGGAECHLSARYRPYGQPSVAEMSLALAQDFSDPFAFTDLAKDLSQRLDKPLEVYEMPNA